MKSQTPPRWSKTEDDSAPGVGPATKDVRRRYKAPRLQRYGRLTDLTLGGSPGIGDSAPGGNPGAEAYL